VTKAGLKKAVKCAKRVVGIFAESALTGTEAKCAANAGKGDQSS
jgi:hypothetical protein